MTRTERKQMSADVINKKAYETKRAIVSYASPRLQIPEVMVLVKYKEQLWGRNVLDVGCGGGRIAVFLRQFKGVYTGIDYSSRMIEFCRAKFRELRFIEGDVRDMSEFEDEEFDFVLFAYNGIDSMNHEGRLCALHEIRRVLKKDAVFAFSSHNINYWNTANYSPRIKLSYNPFRQLKNAVDYGMSTYNHLRNRKYQEFHTNYSIVNGISHNFGVLNYHIDKKIQISQLTDAAFETIEMYDLDGNTLGVDDDDRNSPWIYYVTRKAE